MQRREAQKGPGRPLRGWIKGLESQRTHLERMGVKLGAYNQIEQRFDDCVVDQHALYLLEPHYGRRYNEGQFIWSLR